MVRMVEDAVQEPDLLRLREPLRRYLARVVHDEQELDDLVQETLLRVWEVRGRVGRQAAASYAVATARNLVQSRDRAVQVQRRHAHRLHEPATVDGPEDEALRQEERTAAAEVLDTLPRADLALLSPEEAGGVTRERSARTRSRLARARSRARVDYLLRLRRLDLPTSRCRPVLEALSAGDRRQQERVAVGEHLLTCGLCASCAPALLGRERRLFGIAALPVLLLEPLRRAWDSAPRTTSAVAAGTLVVGALAGGAALHPGRDAPPAPSAAAPSTAAPSAAAPSSGGPAGAGSAGATPAAVPPAAAPPAAAPPPAEPAGAVPPAAEPPAAEPPAAVPPAATAPLVVGVDDLTGQVGRVVVAQAAVVRSVPADEGFWVGTDGGRQAYVRLVPSGGESAAQVLPGGRVSFTGTLQRLVPGVDEGLEQDEGLGLLRQQQTYLAVSPADLAVAP